MPWIQVISDEEATGEVAEVYDKIRKQRNSTRISSGPPGLASLNPNTLWYGAELMWEIMRGPSNLTTQQREMIATVTSLTARCKF